jgi:hypothetical protein
MQNVPIPGNRYLHHIHNIGLSHFQVIGVWEINREDFNIAGASGNGLPQNKT